jgi:DNA-binding response OmpR family regulator
MTKVLIIDDEPAVVDVLEKILQRAGYHVASAKDGTSGLKCQKDDPADIVVNDLIISGGGNFGPMGYKSEAITTSAYLAAAEKAGADAILTKPFDRKELLDAVRRLSST